MKLETAQEKPSLDQERVSSRVRTIKWKMSLTWNGKFPSFTHITLCKGSEQFGSILKYLCHLCKLSPLTRVRSKLSNAPYSPLALGSGYASVHAISFKKNGSSLRRNLSFKRCKVVRVLSFFPQEGAKEIVTLHHLKFELHHTVPKKNGRRPNDILNY